MELMRCLVWYCEDTFSGSTFFICFCEEQLRRRKMNSRGPFLLFAPCYPLLLEKRPLTLPGNKGETVWPRPLYLLRLASVFPSGLIFCDGDRTQGLSGNPQASTCFKSVYLTCNYLWCCGTFSTSWRGLEEGLLDLVTRKVWTEVCIEH